MDFDKEFVKNTEDITGVNDKLSICPVCKVEHNYTGSFCPKCADDLHDTSFSSIENLKARANIE